MSPLELFIILFSCFVALRSYSLISIVLCNAVVNLEHYMTCLRTQCQAKIFLTKL